MKDYLGVFSQIIANLILNSLTHGFEKNRNGQRILDPFFATNRTFGGSGLRLNII